MLLLTLAVLGYQDKAGTYLPPYNWWAQSAAQHMVYEINKFYRGTGLQFVLREVSYSCCCTARYEPPHNQTIECTLQDRLSSSR
jgi:hypothetical protein